MLCLLKLPPAIQQQVANGEISARSAYEISKLSDKPAQQRLAAFARDGELTHRQIAGKVRQRRGKRKTGPRTMKRCSWRKTAGKWSSRPIDAVRTTTSNRRCVRL